MSNPTAQIPVERLPELRAAIDKLNKKADKLGCSPITLETGEPFDKDVDGEIFAYIPVFVNGEAPKLNGWQFVATLEHDENGTIIRRIPTFTDEVDLTAYRTATPDNCDQCHQRRRRNDTYIVAKPSHKFSCDVTLGQGDCNCGLRCETKQVGSSCLKDFLGHENPEQVARFMTELRNLIENVRGGSYDGGRLTPRYSLHSLLAVADHVIAQTGYISRRKAQEDYSLATADVVSNEFFEWLRKLAPEPLTAKVNIDAVIEWVRSLDDKNLENDYLYNLFTVCKSDSITARQFGIAASAIPAYERQLARETERKAQNRVDEFIGDKGDKVDVEFTVVRIFTFDGEYGPSHKHILRDTTGHTLVWSTGTDPLEQGQSYKGTFSVKGQKESKYGKETLIFRPRNLEEV